MSRVWFVVSGPNLSTHATHSTHARSPDILHTQHTTHNTQPLLCEGSVLFAVLAVSGRPTPEPAEAVEHKWEKGKGDWCRKSLSQNDGVVQYTRCEARRLSSLPAKVLGGFSPDAHAVHTDHLALFFLLTQAPPVAHNTTHSPTNLVIVCFS